MVLRKARFITRGNGRGALWKSRLFWALKCSHSQHTAELLHCISRSRYDAKLACDLLLAVNTALLFGSQYHKNSSDR
jgi:hypothetical protein